MKPELSDRFIDYESVKDIWDTVIRLYSKLEDESRMTEPTKRAMELLQEQKSVLEYSNELNTLWSEIDFYPPLPTDPKGRDYILKGRAYRFLTGLRTNFETIRTLLLHREHPMSFDESVVQVIQEESRIKAMQTHFSLRNQAFLIKNTYPPILPTPRQPPNTRYTHGFNAKQSLQQLNYTRKTHQKRKGDPKDSLWCDFCQRHRHTRDRCWKIHGRLTISQSHVMIQPPANAYTWQPTANANTRQPTANT